MKEGILETEQSLHDGELEGPDEYLVEVVLEQIMMVIVKAESSEQAIDLANNQQATPEQQLPPEILTERTRIIM
jgi:hypothetical protein